MSEYKYCRGLCLGYGQADKIIKEQTGKADFSADGRAILFGSHSEPQDNIRMGIEIALIGLQVAANTARNMDQVRNLGDGNVIGDIDPMLRLYLMELAQKTEWFSNCATLNSDLKEFFSFDQFELIK